MIFYGGYKLGQYKVRYEGNTVKELSTTSAKVGGFLSLSTGTLDTLSTTAGKLPLSKDEKKTIGFYLQE